MADGWIPEPYFDEVVPEPKTTPSDWIGALDDGAPALLDFDGEEPERALHDGDRVDFYESRAMGSATLTIGDDGSWSVDREMPAGANLVSCYDLEDSFDTIAAMIESAKESAVEGCGGEFEPGAEYFIRYWYWSARTPFRFDAATRAFVKMEAAHG